MATLLDKEWVGGRLERTWSDIGDNGKRRFVHETVQDVEPAMDDAKLHAQNHKDSVLGRFVANVTGVQLEEACRIECKLWGVSFRECFSEVMQSKTDRAQRVWRMLTKGRDFAKLQASYWR